MPIDHRFKTHRIHGAHQILQRPAVADANTLDHRMTYCASPEYLARRGTPQSLADLAGHDAVAYLRAGTLQHWQVTRPDGTLDEFVPKTRVLMDDLQAISDAAAAGFGIAWLPCRLVRDRVQRGELLQVLADYTGIFFGAYAVWPKTTHLPLKVRLAVDLLADKLATDMSLA